MPTKEVTMNELMQFLQENMVTKDDLKQEIGLVIQRIIPVEQELKILSSKVDKLERLFDSFEKKEVIKLKQRVTTLEGRVNYLGGSTAQS